MIEDAYEIPYERYEEKLFDEKLKKNKKTIIKEVKDFEELVDKTEEDYINYKKNKNMVKKKLSEDVEIEQILKDVRFVDEDHHYQPIQKKPLPKSLAIKKTSKSPIYEAKPKVVISELLGKGQKAINDFTGGLEPVKTEVAPSQSMILLILAVLGCIMYNKK